MPRKITRALGLAAAGLVVAWLGRLKAHSKKPPPQGHWREVQEDELSAS